MIKQAGVVLDLDEHDPEEFEGKVVHAHGATYVIGPYAGSGGDRIVHLMINQRSGLCNHAAKVVRDLQKTRQSLVRTDSHARLAWLFKNSLLYSIPVEVPGGEIELQPVLSNVVEPLPTHPASVDVERAEALVKEKMIEGALAVYEEVLARYPDHTDALMLSGRLLPSVGRAAEGLHRMDRAIRVEPHIENYHLAILRLASAAEMHTAVISWYKRMRAIFPYQSDVDLLCLEAHFALGDLSGAVNDLNQSWLLEAEERTVVVERLRDAAERRRHAREALDRGIAESTTEGPIKIPTVEFVEEAYSSFPEDPKLAAGLGILLMRAGDSRRAKQLLVEAGRKFSFPMDVMCIVNSAFCDIDSGNYAEAMKAIEWSSLAISSRAGSPSEVKWPDVPGRAVWIFETEQGLGHIEDRPEVALKIVDRAIAEAGGSASVPEAVLDYRRWLAIATESIGKS